MAYITNTQFHSDMDGQILIIIIPKNALKKKNVYTYIFTNIINYCFNIL